VMQDSYSEWQKRTGADCKEWFIPPKIHFIWLGSSLPQLCKDIIDSWRPFHPGWEIRVWTDDDVKDFHMKNQQAFDAAKNFGEKSDIWRYEILERFGGIYADCDFECLHSFDELCKQVHFFVGNCYEAQVFLGNGIIGSAPHHPVMVECVNNIKPANGDNNSSRILGSTGPRYLTERYFEVAGRFIGEAVVFPCGYFYPLPIGSRNKNGKRDLLIQQWKKPETMAIHYWSLSWLKGR